VSFLLDTDICSAYLRGNRIVWPKFLQHGGQLHVSAVSAGELYTWASRQGVSPRRRVLLEDFLQDVSLLDVTRTVSEKFGDLRAAFLDAGQGTPDMDLLIASTALVHDFTLITHNTRDFQNIPGLRLQDWLVP
jgi:predicted nucleic acid-binding protein